MSVSCEYRNLNAHGIGKVSSKNIARLSSINVVALNGTESEDNVFCCVVHSDNSDKFIRAR